MKLEVDVLNVLDRSTTNGANLVLPEQLERKLYERVNKALVAAGGKWNRGAKAHVFPGDAADATEQMILTGQITTPQDIGFFETPPAIVARLIQSARLDNSMSVLEPSAGQGAIATEILKVTPHVVCVEKEWQNFQILIARCRTAAIFHEDFLLWAPTKDAKVDRVIMNPPFAKQADVHHVMHAYRFLKSGGLLVAIMSAGTVFRENALTRNFREMVAKAPGHSITTLPEGSFKESGTGVNTVIVTWPRP